MSDQANAAPLPKVDPETLAIRSRPRRPIRFRRGVIIAISAAGSVSLVAVTWMALKPTAFSHLAQPDDLSQPAQAVPDALSGVPSGYSEVPKLGPPLPGDLGRPILERQRQVALQTESPAYAGPPTAQAAVAAREQRLAAQKSAREAGIMFARPQAASLLSEQSGPTSAAPLAAPTAPNKLALDIANDPNGQGQKTDFVATLDPKGDANPHALIPAPSPYVLTAGSVISASLITGLRSDLPGLVTAQVTQGVYDSPTGRTLLVPQGARLIGSYDSVVAYGQRRALLIWQRIVMPDGSSLRIDNAPATDPSGYAGLQDGVDMHSWQLIKGVVLSTLLGVGSEFAFGGDGDLVRALRRSTQDSVSRAGDQLTMRNLNVQPTITIRPGAPVRLLVHKDLVIEPWHEGVN